MRPGRWATAGAWALALATLGLAACGGSSGAPLPPAPAEVVVTMREYRFDYDPAIPAGRVVFRLVNAGKAEHRPSLLPLTDDFPPIDVQLRGTERRALTPFAGTDALEPGDSTVFAVDLVPGRRYAFVSFSSNPDGQTDGMKGMSSEFRTPGPPPSTVPPGPGG